MIVTTDFVFVHLHKAGGTFVSDALLQYLPDARRIGYHYPLSMISPEHDHLPVLGSIRDPLDFYVSYYFFQSGLLASAKRNVDGLSSAELDALTSAGDDPFNGIDVVFEVASGEGALDFAATTANLLSIGSDDALLDEMLRKMPRTFDTRTSNAPPQRSGFRGMNVRAVDLEQIRGTGVGLFSFLFSHLFGESAASAHFLRFEQLRADLLSYLEWCGVFPNDSMTAFIRDATPSNVSKHAEFRSYYDGSLLDMVGERDAALIHEFAYATTSEVSS